MIKTVPFSYFVSLLVLINEKSIHTVFKTGATYDNHWTINCIHLATIFSSRDNSLCSNFVMSFMPKKYGLVFIKREMREDSRFEDEPW